MTTKLNGYEQWMVRQNVEKARVYGIAKVLASLENFGYSRVAAAVFRLHNAETMPGEIAALDVLLEDAERWDGME